MPFSYHLPTGHKCDVCDQLHQYDKSEPIIDSHNGKASSANNFPFHHWYNFVLGYSPEFPNYVLQKLGATPLDLVIDPFMGSGTTLVCCKELGIASRGIDANDFMVEAARTKLNWNIDLAMLKCIRDQVLLAIAEEFNSYNWRDDTQDTSVSQPSLFPVASVENREYLTYVQKRRHEMLPERYISNKPLTKAYLIQDIIEATVPIGQFRDVFNLALTSIIVPISNIRYGPGFGVVKPRADVDVFTIFATKVNRMIKDLESTTTIQQSTQADVQLGDARSLSNSFDPESATLMITSPPYPGDHEYTKHTKLELIFRGYANNLDEFRVIKKRMLRASTTNIYNNDNDREPIAAMASIKAATDLIQERLTSSNATSGFEKLYTKLIWEYFGGMYKSLAECFKTLKPGGQIALLVSDSHAFKMVHIQTAAILQEIGAMLGFVDPEIVLWQLKTSTSHSYQLRENILFLRKPA